MYNVFGYLLRGNAVVLCGMTDTVSEVQKLRRVIIHFRNHLNAYNNTKNITITKQLLGSPSDFKFQQAPGYRVLLNVFLKVMM
jgi:hypothetical protein